MSVVVVGLEQPRTPLSLLERVAVGEDALGKALARLRDRSNLSEVVVLSTCLRTELYAVVERFHEGVADLQEFLAATAGTTVDALAEHVTVLFDEDVTAHLFEVAAGLRSAVAGETEVLGQVRRAAARAEAERASGPVLTGLFRHAVRAGRRVRSVTAIARGSTSLSHVAVELVESRLGGSLADKRVVVVGAGEMAEGVVDALGRRALEEVVVANRTAARARSLAARAPARAVGLDALAGELVRAHAVIVSTGAAEHVLDAELLASASALWTAQRDGITAQRNGATGHHGRDDPSDDLDGGVVLVDMGMPRNIDPSAGALPQVTLYDIEDLNALAERAVADRHGELDEARRIVREEVERYRADERARGAAPVVSALRQRLEALLSEELARHGTRLAALDERSRREVESVVHDVMAKVAHPPTAALKEAAGTPRGERLVEALRTLFDL